MYYNFKGVYKPRDVATVTQILILLQYNIHAHIVQHWTTPCEVTKTLTYVVLMVCQHPVLIAKEL